MTLQPIYATPGVQLTNSPYASGKQWGYGSGRTALGRYSEAQNCEFIAGFPQKVAGFSALLAAGNMIGVPRAIRSWRDVNGIIRLVIGTDSHLYTCLPDGSGLTDITPRNQIFREVTNAAGTITYQMRYATTAGSNVVAISIIGGGTTLNLAAAAMLNGDWIGFNWDATATASTGQSFQGIYQVSGVSAGSRFNLTNVAPASVTASGVCNCNLVLFRTQLGSNPLATVSGSSTVTVTVPSLYTLGFDANGLPTTCGLYVTFAGALAFNNVTINGEYLLTPIVGNQTQYTIQAATVANATGSGGSNEVTTTYTPAMTQYYTAPSPSTALVFTERALPSAQPWSSVCYGNAGFVAVASNTNVGAYSADGITWTATTMPSSQPWSTVCYGNGQYFALCYGNSVTAKSSDGINWTQGTLPTTSGTYITPGVASFTDAYGNLYSITSTNVALENGSPIPSDGFGHQAGEYYGGIVYFQTASGTGQWYTWNGSYFSACSAPPIPVPSAVGWTGIVYGAGLYVAVSASVGGSVSSISLSSPDGVTWTQNAMPSAQPWQAIAYNGSSVFVAIEGGSSYGATAASSTDGKTWTARAMPTNAYWNSVAWGGATFVAVSGHVANTIAATSPDGVTWTQRTMPVSAIWTSVTYGDGVFVSVAGGTSNTIVATSANGISWTTQTMPATAPWTLLASGAGVVTALAYNSTIAAIAPSAPGPAILPIGWTLAAYGGLMAASPIGGSIYLYDPLGSGSINYAYPLGNAPGHTCAMFVTPERIIVALGASQGTLYDTPQITENVSFGGSNMTVMWSDQTDPTQWQSTTANTAQSGRTLQGGDYFVGGIAVRDGTSLIFTNRCCFSMTYSGDYLVYDTPLLADNSGLVSPYAVAAEGGVAFWMNDCDLYAWTGSVAALATDDVRSSIFSSLNPAYLYKAVAGFNRVKKQVKFWYPSTSTSTENDGCLIFQTDSLVFSTGTISRTGWTDSNLGSLPFGVDALGNLYQEETGVDANGQPLVATLVFAPLDISNGDRCVDMFGFTPDFERQTGDLILSINTQYHPQDPITVTGPYAITTTDSNPEIDLRCDGKLIGWTVQSNVVGGDFRMGLCRVNFSPAGSRN